MICDWAWIGGGGGSAEDRAKLEQLAIDQLPRCLETLSHKFLDQNPSRTIATSDLSFEDRDAEASTLLESLFVKYGSDKSTQHDYHLIYAPIFRRLPRHPVLLEIGLGSGDPSILSNMGANAQPGASLKAYMDFFGDGSFYGADIDRTIQVEGAKTSYVDQTDVRTFSGLGLQSKNGAKARYDCIIEDGLHSVNASLNTLSWALDNISPDGFIVIEDIPKIENITSIWKTVSMWMHSAKWHSVMIDAKGGGVLVVSRRSLNFL